MSATMDVLEEAMRAIDFKLGKNRQALKLLQPVGGDTEHLRAYIQGLSDAMSLVGEFYKKEKEKEESEEGR